LNETVIETLANLRFDACDALAKTFAENRPTNPSEVQLRDAFHANLGRASGVTTEGWYTPPPLGVIMAIGNAPSYERIGRQSYRPEATWPSNEHRLEAESVVYAYSSRVHIGSGAIGDMACTLYSGSSTIIKDHLRRVWDVTLAIVDETAVGVPFSEIYRRSGQLIDKAGFQNNIYSAHDGTTTNIGHTIPWSYELLREDEAETLRSGDRQQIADMVSAKRRFVRAGEDLEVQDGMAFTIEPRLSGAGLPTVSFHIVVGFENSKRIVLSNYQRVFESFEMTGFTH
jgi:hypothetical protein